MKREKISEAIGGISQRHIDEALDFKQAAPVTRKRAWVKWTAVAACLTLIICLLPLALHLINKGNTPHTEEAGANPLEVGNWYVNSNEDSRYFCTNIYYKSCKDNKITILLEKADSEIIYWHLSGSYIKDTWLDENGKPDYDLTQYYASTDSNYKDYGIRVEDAFTFIVNGEQADAFPTQAGVYEITIDFTKLAEKCTVLDYYLVSSYEAFYLGEQKEATYPDGWGE